MMDDVTDGQGFRPQLPSPPPEACLVILRSSFSSATGKVHPLVKPEVWIGRDRELDIHLPDEGVSRRHAKILHAANQDVLVDLESTNGLTVNGAPVTTCRLRHGDQISLGRTATLKYAIKDPLELRCAYLSEQAQEAVRTRDEFLSIASHELKTPLTSLQLNLQSLRRTVLSGASGKALTPEEVARKLELIDRQCHRLDALITDLLDVSRVRLGRLELVLERFDLREMIEDLLARLAESFERAGCEVSFRARTAAVGRWDRSRIEQVVTNLLTNAKKYGAGKPIEVSLEVHGSRVEVRVRDHGIGIAPEHQVRIFERFERAVSARHFGGLGLGLYIARQILEAHRGSIHVESRAGEGSTFLLELPLAMRARQPSSAEA